MASTYKPPHLRTETNPAITDTMFPSLGNAQTTGTNWKPSVAFSKLANEWQEKDDEEARIEQERRNREARKETFNIYVPFAPLYEHRDRLREDSEFNYESRYEEVARTSPIPTAEDSEWVEVKPRRKPHKVKTIEEIVERREEEERRVKEQNDTNWVDNGPETHETYWDRRY